MGLAKTEVVVTEGHKMLIIAHDGGDKVNKYLDDALANHVIQMLLLRFFMLSSADTLK